MFIASALLLLGFIISALALQDNQRGNPAKFAQKIDINQITNLSSEGDCKKSISELGNVKSSNDDAEGSISLLSYRANCYFQNRQYKEALQDTEELKTFYQKTNNTQLVEQANKFIEQLKKYIANPPPETKPSFDGDQDNAAFRDNLKNLQERGDNEN